MLPQQLSEAWRFRERAFPISPVLTLMPEGLVLGAGIVALPTEESRRLKSVSGQELRVLALLSAAYGRQIAAAGGRPIRWYFAEPEAAAFATKIFDAAKGGRENIKIELLPWPGSKR